MFILRFLPKSLVSTLFTMSAHHFLILVLQSIFSVEKGSPDTERANRLEGAVATYFVITTKNRFITTFFHANRGTQHGSFMSSAVQCERISLDWGTDATTAVWLNFVVFGMSLCSTMYIC